MLSDTGIGIAPELIEHVLTPCGQVDNDQNRRHKGSGLSLPLTKKLIEALGAHFDFASKPETGTTVTIRFPKQFVIAPSKKAPVTPRR